MTTHQATSVPAADTRYLTRPDGRIGYAVAGADPLIGYARAFSLIPRPRRTGSPGRYGPRW